MHDFKMGLRKRSNMSFVSVFWRCSRGILYLSLWSPPAGARAAAIDTDIEKKFRARERKKCNASPDNHPPSFPTFVPPSPCLHSTAAMGKRKLGALEKVEADL